MADQSHMYTGLTSVTPTPNRSKAAAKARQERIEKKQEERHKLQGEVAPGRLAIEFKKEIDKLMFAPYPNEDKMTDVQFRIERRARRLAIQNLISIQTRVTNVLRERPDPKQDRARLASEKLAAEEMDLSTDDFDE